MESLVTCLVYPFCLQKKRRLDEKSEHILDIQTANDDTVSELQTKFPINGFGPSPMGTLICLKILRQSYRQDGFVKSSVIPIRGHEEKLSKFPNRQYF